MSRRVFSIAAALFAATAIFGAEAPPVATEPPVELPPLLVEEINGNAPHWRYAAIPGYEILSCCSDEATAQFVLEYYRLHEQFKQMVPAVLRSADHEPATLIVYQQSRSESLSKEIMQALDRAQKTAESQGGVRTPPNFDLRDPDSAVLFSLIDDYQEDIPFGLNWGQAAGELDGPHYVLSAEHIRALLQDRAPAPPPWFIYGLSAFYSGLSSTGRTVHFDPDPWLSSDEADAVEDSPDALRPLLPLSELLIGHLPPPAADRGSARYREVWCAEAELFVRWALNGAVPGRREALWQLADAAARQPMTEALFRRYFGLGFSDARDELSDYLPAASSGRLELTLDPLPAPPALDLRNALPEEIHRINGDWARRTLRLIRDHHPKLLPVYIDQARNTLQHAYDVGERSPRLVTDLGLLYADIGAAPQARRYLEAAYAAGVVRPAALAQLAALRLAEAEAHPAGPNGRLSAAQAEPILALARASRRVKPAQAVLYAVVSDLCRHGAGAPTAEERAFATEGAQLFPSASWLGITASICEARWGDPQLAGRLVEMGLWTATDPASIDRLKSLRNALRPKQASLLSK